MSTITAILEADAAGTLHLPLPAELRKSKLKVTATLQAVREPSEHPTKEDALAALRKLRELGTFKEIADPVAWQRESRVDRPLPGRGVIEVTPYCELLAHACRNAKAGSRRQDVYYITID